VLDAKKQPEIIGSMYRTFSNRSYFLLKNSTSK